MDNQYKNVKEMFDYATPIIKKNIKDGARGKFVEQWARRGKQKETHTEVFYEKEHDTLIECVFNGKQFKRIFKIIIGSYYLNEHFNVCYYFNREMKWSDIYLIDFDDINEDEKWMIDLKRGNYEVFYQSAPIVMGEKGKLKIGNPDDDWLINIDKEWLLKKDMGDCK